MATLLPIGNSNQLVIDDNLKGALMNSNLELTATEAHLNVVANEVSGCAQNTIATFHDNAPVVHW